MESIQKTDVMGMLLTACPSFQQRWQEHRAYWGDDDPLVYIDLGEIAHHLVDLCSTGKVEEFPRVFEVVEELCVNGDSYVRGAATVGLLEGIQNVSLNRNLDAEVFVKYLKPQSHRWWNKLNDFWSKGIPLTDD